MHSLFLEKSISYREISSMKTKMKKFTKKSKNKIINNKIDVIFI